MKESVGLLKSLLMLSECNERIERLSELIWRFSATGIKQRI